ncbi:MAG: MerR family transcriptional regulator [Proteobacteria bacterium]|nr:MerR family transcriptional regulator [Pseudomonadota bacterium]
MDRAGIKIGQLMKATGVTRATIHHYVKEGLLPEPVKTSRNMALYGPDCVDRVLLIKSLQKTSRRSLAEVKAIIEGQSGPDGIQRLRDLMEVEETRSQASLLNPERKREPMTAVQIAERTGFSMEELEEFEELDLLRGREQEGERFFHPGDVDVADALAALGEGGFAQDFVAQDAIIYLDALRELLHKEVATFLERMPEGSDPQDVIELAQRGIERVTPLLLALRRKLIREFIDAAPLP